MTQISVLQLSKATGSSLLTAARWLPHLSSAMEKYGIDTPTRQAAFLAQVGVESMNLRRVEEDLFYSAKRLTQVWPKRFPDEAAAAPFSKNPRALGNKVYGGRMGNVDAQDGYKYRGRGLKQLTGKDNYTAYALASGLDVINDPDLLLEPSHAADSAAWFWSSNGCNSYADKCDWQGLTKRINGGLNGYAERLALTKTALNSLA